MNDSKPARACAREYFRQALSAHTQKRAGLHGGPGLFLATQRSVSHRSHLVAATALASAIAWIAGATLALAAEPTAELPAGGLSYAAAPDLSTEREDIVIAADRIRISYTIQNMVPEPRKVLIAFALPDVDMLGLDGSPVENAGYELQNPDNYVGFTGLVDGQAVETFADKRAMALGLLDMTAKLIEYKLPLYPLEPGLAEKIAALTDEARTDLTGRSMIRLTEGVWEPIWRLKSTLFWQQSFAPSQSHTLSLSYRPITGVATWTADTASAFIQRYCIPPNDVAALTKRSEAGSPAQVRWLTFQAPTGAAGRGPASAYRVAIQTAGPSQKAFTCNDGLGNATTTNRETTRAAYVPDEDVLVLFVD